MRDDVCSAPEPGLRRVPALQVFSPEHLTLLRDAGVVETWQHGDVLLRQGERADRAILLRKGVVKVVSESVGGYTSLLAFRGAGELVGELACIDGGTRSASVIATQDGHGVAVSGSRFAALLRANGDLGLAVLRSISARLRHSDVQREAMGAEPAATRVARLLVNGTTAYAGGSCFPASASTAGTAVPVCAQIRLAVGDYVELQMQHAAPAALSVKNAAGDASRLIAVWKSR